jgi:hypothetical protein
MPLNYCSLKEKETNRKCEVSGDVHSGGLPENFLHFDEAMGKQAHIRSTVLKQGLSQIKWLVAVFPVPAVKLLSLLMHHPACAIILFRGQAVQHDPDVFQLECA